MTIVNTGEVLKSARHRSHLTQRELARRTGIAQPTIARIETGQADPLISTVERLLQACGARLHVEVEPGYGVDRTQMRELLKLTPAQRLSRLEGAASGLADLEQAIRR
jgi:transcriptional regulator with XRE-family HTH domain